MRQQTAEIRKSLIPADAHPLEELLARRVATCWLAAHIAERKALLCGGVSFREREWLDRRADRAHRRLLQSIRALATFRKVDPAPLLLNVVGQQNVANVAIANPPAVPGPATRPQLEDDPATEPAPAEVSTPPASRQPGATRRGRTRRKT
jgi:hypothetical protein